jgi:hypothetical protein
MAKNSKKLHNYALPCSEEPLPLLPHTAFAWPFFIVASSSAAGHPIKKGHADSVMQPNESMMRARNLLLELLFFLSIWESYDGTPSAEA